MHLFLFNESEAISSTLRLQFPATKAVKELSFTLFTLIQTKEVQLWVMEQVIILPGCYLRPRPSLQCFCFINLWSAERVVTMKQLLAWHWLHSWEYQGQQWDQQLWWNLVLFLCAKYNCAMRLQNVLIKSVYQEWLWNLYLKRLCKMYLTDLVMNLMTLSNLWMKNYSNFTSVTVKWVCKMKQ